MTYKVLSGMLSLFSLTLVMVARATYLSSVMPVPLPSCTLVLGLVTIKNFFNS